MYQGVIDATRKEVIRLIDDQVDGLFALLLRTPDFLKKQDLQRNVSSELIEQWTEVIKGEACKTQRSEAILW